MPVPVGAAQVRLPGAGFTDVQLEDRYDAFRLATAHSKDSSYANEVSRKGLYEQRA